MAAPPLRRPPGMDGDTYRELLVASMIHHGHLPPDAAWWDHDRILAYTKRSGRWAVAALWVYGLLAVVAAVALLFAGVG